MDPATIGAIAGVGMAGLSSMSQGGANQMNYKIAKKQMRFQKNLFTNKRQYDVQDLRKAGLNPILATGVGAGGTPQGAQATMQPEVNPQTAKLMAGEFSRVSAETAKATAEANTAKSIASKADADATVSKAVAEQTTHNLGINKRYGIRSTDGMLARGVGSLLGTAKEGISEKKVPWVKGWTEGTRKFLRWGQNRSLQQYLRNRKKKK